MKILVTAGNTQTEIDRVRCITNIFSGRTGTNIALEAAARGHEVCLLTSHPELAVDRSRTMDETLEVLPYRTFGDLKNLMENTLTGRHFDAVIHCAAVSDYELAGVYTPEDDATFCPVRRTFGYVNGHPQLRDAAAGKVKSHHNEVWLRLVPTPKLIDMIRSDWGFDGFLVKFKLEVSVSDDQLLQIADASRRHSRADLIVANTLESYRHYAFFLDEQFVSERVPRHKLSIRLVALLEQRTTQLIERASNMVALSA